MSINRQNSSYDKNSDGIAKEVVTFEMCREIAANIVNDHEFIDTMVGSVKNILFKVVGDVLFNRRSTNRC